MRRDASFSSFRMKVNGFSPSLLLSYLRPSDSYSSSLPSRREAGGFLQDHPPGKPRLELAMCSVGEGEESGDTLNIVLLLRTSVAL